MVLNQYVLDHRRSATKMINPLMVPGGLAMISNGTPALRDVILIVRLFLSFFLLFASWQLGDNMTHIALLGDFIIDNGAYVGRGPDVAEQVRKLVPDEWKVTRSAIDGAVASIIFSQLEDLPPDTTHIVISVGGNDALGEADVLDAPAHSVADVLQQFARIQDRFRENYASMLDATAQRNLPTAVCTVYDPRYPDPLRRRMGSLGLSVINYLVTREAFSRGSFSDRPTGDVRCRRRLRQSD